MPFPSTAGIAAIAALRYGCPEVLEETLSTTDPVELVLAVGEVSAAVNGVVRALAGHGDQTLGLCSLPEPDSIGELAHLAVRCAAENDRTGLEVICLQAVDLASIGGLVRSMIEAVNQSLDALGRLPGADADGLLARFGLAAARRAA